MWESRFAMATSDVRVRIYLPKRLHRALGQTARRRGVSMAQLLREGAEMVLREAQEAVPDPLADLIGSVKSGPSDLSEKHDGFEWVASRRRSLRHWVNGLARLLRPGP